MKSVYQPVRCVADGASWRPPRKLPKAYQFDESYISGRLIDERSSAEQPISRFYLEIGKLGPHPRIYIASFDAVPFSVTAEIDTRRWIEDIRRVPDPTGTR
jgi:hypothetical protein